MSTGNRLSKSHVCLHGLCKKTSGTPDVAPFPSRWHSRLGFRFRIRFRVQGSGFRVQGSGFRVQGAGFRVQGSGFRVQGSGFRVQGAGFRVQGAGLRFQGSG